MINRFYGYQIWNKDAEAKDVANRKMRLRGESLLICTKIGSLVLDQYGQPESYENMFFLLEMTSNGPKTAQENYVFKYVSYDPGWLEFDFHGTIIVFSERVERGVDCHVIDWSTQTLLNELKFGGTNIESELMLSEQKIFSCSSELYFVKGRTFNKETREAGLE